MSIYYEEGSSLGASLKNNFREVGILPLAGRNIADDYLVVNGMRHFISLKKRGFLLKNYLFLDSGYFGNYGKGIPYFRAIPNDLHPTNFDVPSEDIFDFFYRYDVSNETAYLERLEREYRYQDYSEAIIIPPSVKYCKLDKIKREKWISEVTTRKAFTEAFDSFLIRRKIKSRRERMVNNPIENDLEGKRALICHSSLTSIDAAILGAPFIDLGQGPLASRSFSIKKIKNGVDINREELISLFNKLLFYQSTTKDIGKKLFEVMEFHKVSQGASILQFSSSKLMIH